MEIKCNFLSVVLLFVNTCSVFSVEVLNAGSHFTNLYGNNLKNMLNMLDDEVEPCDDFFQHVCGYPDADTVNPAEASVPPFLYNRENRAQFFEHSLRDFGTQPGTVLRTMYNDCKARGRRNVLHATAKPQWQRMLREIPFLARHAKIYRNWPFLRFEWEELVERQLDELNWVILAADFAAHGIPSLLHIYFAEQTIFIAAAEHAQCPSLEQVESSLLPLLQHRSAQVAQVIGNELWQFCRLLTAQQPLSGEIYVVENSSNILIDATTSVYFETFFTSLNISADEVSTARKLPVDVKRLAELLTVVRTTEPRIIFNFILWHAYESLKYEDCYLLTEEFEQLLLSEYWHWHVFEPHFGREVALATYLYHTTRFQRQRRQAYARVDWYEFLHKKPTRTELNVERMIRRYANVHLDSRNLSALYADEPLVPGSFYGNLLSLRRLQLRHSFSTPIVDAEDLNHPLYFLRQFLHYSILVLHQPLFHYFATQGFDMWHASDWLYSTDGFYTALDCLERQSLLHADEASIFSVLSEDQVDDVFRFYGAFVEVYRDYRFWLAGESFAFAEDFVLSYFELNSQRVMFYAVAQLYCGRNDALYKTLINRSFMNMPEFQQVFSCATDSPMNPPAKCMIRNCD